jgi:hypothetical protein
MSLLTRCLWTGALGLGILAGCSAGPTPVTEKDAGGTCPSKTSIIDGGSCSDEGESCIASLVFTGCAGTQSSDDVSCTCKSGKWACAIPPMPLYMCPPDSGTDAGHDAAVDSGPDAADAAQCNSGDTKKADCNTCYCQGGAWGCTTMFCGDSGQHD